MTRNRERIIRGAEKLVSKGRIEAAIREYRKVLADYPDDVNTLNRLGDLFARAKRNDEAVELFERIAVNYTDDGFFVKAIAIYKKIIKLDPTRTEIYERLAELYHRQGLTNEARTQYQVLADYHTKHGNTGSAIAIYQRMVEVEPENPSNHVRLAELFRQMGQLDKAMVEYATIADLMIEHKRPEEAAKVFERALDVDASDMSFITDAVVKLRSAARPGEAARFLALAVQRNPEAAAVAQQIGGDLEDSAASPTAPAAELSEVVTGEGPGEPAAAPAPPEPEPVELSPEEPPAEEDDARAMAPEEVEDAAAEHELDLDLEVELPVVEVAGEEAVPAAEPASVEEAAAAAEKAAAEMELDLEDVESLELDFELDLDEDVEESGVKPPPDMRHDRPGSAWLDPQDGDDAVAAAEADSVEEITGTDIDPDFLERTAAELRTDPEVSESDLLTEAEVLVKYGLLEKAADKLDHALALSPDNLDAVALRLRMALEGGGPEEVVEWGGRLAAATTGADDQVPWVEARARLLEAGYGVDGTTVTAPASEAGAASAVSDEPAAREAAEAEAEPAVSAAPGDGAAARRRQSREVDRLVSDLLGTVGKKKRKKEPAAPEPEPATSEPEGAAAPEEPAPPPEESGLGPEPVSAYPGLESEEDFTLHGIFDEVRVDSTSPPSIPPAEELAAAAPAAMDDTGTSWLDEVDEDDPDGPAETTILDDDFFDLAGELEQELSAEEAMRGPDFAEPAREQTLDEIVEGFKQGVAENLSEEDHATHFNLGIAYREMGLLDEAIGEFQISARSPELVVDSCSMLGLCFQEKGLPELALKWYRHGLESPSLSEEETLGLLYDMGNIYLASDDRDAAKKTFVEIYGINSNYRDVVAKLEEVR